MPDISISQETALRRAIERRFGQSANGYRFSRRNSEFTITDEESGSWVRGTFSESGRLTVRSTHDAAFPVEPAPPAAPVASDPVMDDEEDDGCPKNDPECLGNNGDCHDACEAPATSSDPVPSDVPCYLAVAYHDGAETVLGVFRVAEHASAAEAEREAGKLCDRIKAAAPGSNCGSRYSGGTDPEVITGNGEFRAGRGAIVTGWFPTRDEAIAEFWSLSAMVPQVSQQQQAKAKAPPRGERRYVTVRDTETGEVHRVLTSVARVGFAVVVFVPSNRHRQGALNGMLITHDDTRKAWVFNDEAEARHMLSRNHAPGERVIPAELVSDPAI